jgi:uncharacterized protein with PQ loop repeat
MILWIATGLAVIATLPQLVHTLQTWSVEDLNGTSIGLALLSNLLFLLHSVRVKTWAYATVSAWFMLYGVTLSYVKFTSESPDSLRA